MSSIRIGGQAAGHKTEQWPVLERDIIDTKDGKTLSERLAEQEQEPEQG